MELFEFVIEFLLYLWNYKNDGFSSLNKQKFGSFKSHHKTAYMALCILCGNEMELEFLVGNLIKLYQTYTDHIEQTTAFFSEHDTLMQLLEMIIRQKCNFANTYRVNDVELRTFMELKERIVLAYASRITTASSSVINGQPISLNSQPNLNPNPSLDNVSINEQLQELRSDIQKLFVLFQNNVNISTTVNNNINSNNFSSFSNNFTSFTQAKFLISKNFNKLARYKNHIQMFETHLINKTTPPSLFYNKFPQPFLADDEAYVDDYNNLVSDFQAKAMNLAKTHLEKRINNLEDDLLKIKESLSSDPNINNKFDDLKLEVEGVLKEDFLKKSEKVLKTKAIKFKVLNQQNKNHQKNFNSEGQTYDRIGSNNRRSNRINPVTSNIVNNNNNFRTRPSVQSNKSSNIETNLIRPFDQSRLDFRTAIFSKRKN